MYLPVAVTGASFSRNSASAATSGRAFIVEHSKGFDILSLRTLEGCQRLIEQPHQPAQVLGRRLVLPLLPSLGAGEHGGDLLVEHLDRCVGQAAL